MTIVAIARGFPWGRYLSKTMAVSARRAIRPRNSRKEIDDSWQRYRELHIEETRPIGGPGFTRRRPPPYQRLMHYAGMDPEHGLIRWANFNWTILLPSKVFEVDDAGTLLPVPTVHALRLAIECQRARCSG